MNGQRKSPNAISRTLFLITAFTILSLVIILLAFPATTEAETITVEQAGGGDYTTIKDAIENSTDGNTILVGPGNYSVSAAINNSISLRSRLGPESTLLFPEYVEENGTFEVVETPYPSILFLNATNITIEGFTFSALPTNVQLNESTAQDYNTYCIAIMLNSSNSSRIENNSFLIHPESDLISENLTSWMYCIRTTGENISLIRIENNTAVGMYYFVTIQNVHDAIIANNTVKNVFNFGYMIYSNVVIVRDNFAHADQDYLFENYSSFLVLWVVNNFSINNNSIFNTNHVLRVEYGIDLHVRRNTVIELFQFIELFGGHQVTIQGNTIIASQSQIPLLSTAFSLENSYSVSIEGNSISNFSLGIKPQMVTELHVGNNTFSNNTCDIWITGYEGGEIDGDFWLAAIEGNTFESSFQSGFGTFSIIIEDFKEFSLENNTFRGRNQISLLNSKNFSFHNNHLFDTELQLDYAYPTSASGNTMDGREILFIVGKDGKSYSLPGAWRIVVIDSLDLILENLSMDGGSIQLTIIGSPHIKVQNSTFHNATTYGILIQDSEYCGVLYSTFSSSQHGIYVEASDGFYVNHSTFSQSSIGIRVRESDLVTVVDSDFIDGEIGINFNDVSLGLIKVCQFEYLDHGIKTYRSEVLNISSSTFTNIRNSAVHLFGGDGIIVASNDISDVTTGLEFLNTPKCHIINNSVTGFTSFGISLNATSGDAEVEDNNINGGTNSGYGLFIQFSNNNNISGNTIKRNEYGIYIENSSKNYFRNNSIVNNIYGVYLRSFIIGTQFEYNTIENNTQGAQAEDTIGRADMSWNYWGDITGPHHPQNNSHGAGDKVSDDITILPFQTNPDEQRPEIPDEGEDESDFFIGLTESQFRIMVVDLVIIIGVVVLLLVGFRSERNLEKEREMKPKKMKVSSEREGDETEENERGQ